MEGNSSRDDTKTDGVTQLMSGNFEAYGPCYLLSPNPVRSVWPTSQKANENGTTMTPQQLADELKKKKHRPPVLTPQQLAECMKKGKSQRSKVVRQEIQSDVFASESRLPSDCHVADFRQTASQGVELIGPQQFADLIRLNKLSRRNQKSSDSSYQVSTVDGHLPLADGSIEAKKKPTSSSNREFVRPNSTSHESFKYRCFRELGKRFFFLSKPERRAAIDETQRIMGAEFHTATIADVVEMASMSVEMNPTFSPL